MSRQTSQEELAMRYLLGTLSDEERARVEERYFSDDTEFEEVEIAEEELIDQYVRGELAKGDRDRFEANIAGSPRLTERVQFARVWKDKLSASPTQPSASGVKSREADRIQARWWSRLFGFSTKSRAPRLAIAFSVLIVGFGGIALLSGWMKIRESRRLAEQQAAVERQRELDEQAADLKSRTDQLANLTPQPSPTHVSSPPKQIYEQSPSTNKPFVALVLSPGGTRSLGSKGDLRIPAGTKDVQLTLNLRDPDYTTYNATIRPVDGAPVFSPRSLTPRRTRAGAVLKVSVPANLLPPGDYLINLEGRTATGTTDSVDDYSFRVIK